jgi:ABC-type ATPase involved in cell division
MLDSDERRRHLYLVGQTGTGKSTLLLNLIWQDLLAGDGLALLDPHGERHGGTTCHFCG